MKVLAQWAKSGFAIGAGLVAALMLVPQMQALDFSYTAVNGAATIIGYTGPGGEVTIPSTIDGLPVTSLASNVFWLNSTITSVTIPKGVMTIEDGSYYKGGGMGTFWQCTNLHTVALGDSLTHIGFGAFQGCVSLTRIRIPDAVTTIGDFAFNNCASLTNVIVGRGVSSVGTAIGYAFAGCTSLVAIYFQGNAPFLASDANAFRDDNNLIIYYLPGTTGWGTSFGGRPTAVWTLPYPVILTTASSFGIQANAFGFTISWGTNGSVVVEASTNLALQTWQPLQTNALTGGSYFFADAVWTNYPRRFYRVRSP